MGLVRRGGVGGQATMGTRIAYSVMNPATLAHEIGHNFGRLHATPCTGTIPFSDPLYPHTDGTIGSWGWDRRNGALVSAKAGDVMGACAVVWVSDYMWGGALQYRAQRDTTFGLGRTAALTIRPQSRSLILVTGALRAGRATIRVRETLAGGAPVAVVDAQEGGRVILRDAEGRVVADVPVQLVTLADSHEEYVFAGLVDRELVTVRGGSVELVRNGRSVGRSSLDTP